MIAGNLYQLGITLCTFVALFSCPIHKVTQFFLWVIPVLLSNSNASLSYKEVSLMCFQIINENTKWKQCQDQSLLTSWWASLQPKPSLFSSPQSWSPCPHASLTSQIKFPQSSPVKLIISCAALYQILYWPVNPSFCFPREFSVLSNAAFKKMPFVEPKLC